MLIISMVYEMWLSSFWTFADITCFQASFELLYQTVLWEKTTHWTSVFLILQSHQMSGSMTANMFFSFFNPVWNRWNLLKEWVNKIQQNNYFPFQYKLPVIILIKKEKMGVGWGENPHTKIKCNEKKILIHRKEVGFKP